MVGECPHKEELTADCRLISDEDGRGRLDNKSCLYPDHLYCWRYQRARAEAAEARAAAFERMMLRADKRAQRKAADAKFYHEERNKHRTHVGAAEKRVRAEQYRAEAAEASIARVKRELAGEEALERESEWWKSLGAEQKLGYMTESKAMGWRNFRHERELRVAIAEAALLLVRDRERGLAALDRIAADICPPCSALGRCDGTPEKCREERRRITSPSTRS